MAGILVKKFGDTILNQEPALISYSLYYVFVVILVLVFIWKQTFSPISPLLVTNIATGICLAWDFIIHAFGNTKETSIAICSRSLWLISFAFLINMLLIIYHRLMVLKKEEGIKLEITEKNEMLT